MYLEENFMETVHFSSYYISIFLLFQYSYISVYLLSKQVAKKKKK